MAGSALRIYRGPIHIVRIQSKEGSDSQRAMTAARRHLATAPVLSHRCS